MCVCVTEKKNMIIKNTIFFATIIVALIATTHVYATTCPQNFASNYHLNQVDVTDANGVKVTAEGRSRTGNCYGSGCVVHQEYKCPTDTQWYELGTISVDTTKAKKEQSQKSGTIKPIGKRGSGGGGRSTFTCCSQDDCSISEVILEHLDSVWGGNGELETYPARTNTQCVWGGCSTTHEFEYETNLWCELAGTN